MNRPKAYRVIGWAATLATSLIFLADAEWAEATPKGADVIVDADRDGLEDEREATLLKRYAPQVYLHPEERFALSNVDTYLSLTEMRFNRTGGCPDYSVLKPGNNTQSKLIAQERYKHSGFTPFCGDSNTLIRSTENRTNRDEDGFFLHHPDGTQENAIRAGNLTTAIIYGHAFPQPGGAVELQYWFFYGYDETPGVPSIAHEGDWEHIRIELQPSTDTLHRAYYAAHGDEGRWYSPEQIRWVNDNGQPASSGHDSTHTHPLVYAALGKHASYPTAGSQHRPNLPDDQTGAGPSINSWNRLINVGETWAPQNNQHFIQYGGLWGEIGTQDYTTGPATPSHQTGWGKPTPTH